MTRILLPNLTRAVVGLIALLMASPLAAQNANNQTQLRVVVVDETGAGIPQATIVVTPVNGEAVTFTTDERGLDVANSGGGDRSTPRRVPWVRALREPA